VALSIAESSAGAGVIRLTPDGEIELSTVEVLHSAVANAVSRSRPDTVIVDLEAVTFLDSTGIAALVRARHFADAHGTSYQVVNARDQVRWVLDISGVWTYLGGDAAPASG
jgi:anti-anti-sigma factor